MVDAVRAELDDTFDAMYAVAGSAQRAAEDVVEGDGADGAVLDPLGAAVLRTAQLRLVVQDRPAHPTSHPTNRLAQGGLGGIWWTAPRTNRHVTAFLRSQ